MGIYLEYFEKLSFNKHEDFTAVIEPARLSVISRIGTIAHMARRERARIFTFDLVADGRRHCFTDDDAVVDLDIYMSLLNNAEEVDFRWHYEYVWQPKLKDYTKIEEVIDTYPFGPHHLASYMANLDDAELEHLTYAYYQTDDTQTYDRGKLYAYGKIGGRIHRGEVEEKEVQELPENVIWYPHFTTMNIEHEYPAKNKEAVREVAEQVREFAGMVDIELILDEGEELALIYIDELELHSPQEVRAYAALMGKLHSLLYYEEGYDPDPVLGRYFYSFSGGEPRMLRIEPHRSGDYSFKMISLD